MQTLKIIKTEVQGIEAKDLLAHFADLQNRLKELQETIKPRQSTELLTRKEVATMIDVSLPTLHSWTKNGILKSYRIGNKVRYKKNEVFASLESINPVGS